MEGPSNFRKSQPIMETGQNKRDSKGMSFRVMGISVTCMVKPISLFQDSGNIAACSGVNCKWVSSEWQPDPAESSLINDMALNPFGNKPLPIPDTPKSGAVDN